MNILKRALISITRRKNNSIIMFLIVFILSNVLLITLTVNNSLKNTKDMVLNQFTPVVNIIINSDTYDEEKTPKMSLDKVEALYNKTKDIVKTYDYSLGLSLYKTKDIHYSDISDQMAVANEYSDNLILSGTQLSSTTLVEKNEAKLIDGKGFSKEDITKGTPKVIVSKQFAEANALSVGTIINLENVQHDMKLSGSGGFEDGEPFFSEEIELEVVGIIEIKEVEDFLKKQIIEENKNTPEVGDIQTIADRLYTPNNFLSPLIKANNERAYEKYKDEAKDMIFDKFSHITPEFVLKDMKYLDEFTTYAKQVYNEKYFLVNSVANEYETVAKPLNSMSSLLDLIFKITILTSIVIISLVLCIFMYFRKKEMGILLALGEKRKKILIQSLLETLIIAIVAATLAIFTSMIFSNMLMENTINSLMSADISNKVVSYGSNFGLDVSTIVQQYQGGFDLLTIIVFYVTMIATIIISQLATMLYLLRLNPKKILM